MQASRMLKQPRAADGNGNTSNGTAMTAASTATKAQPGQDPDSQDSGGAGAPPAPTSAASEAVHSDDAGSTHARSRRTPAQKRRRSATSSTTKPANSSTTAARAGHASDVPANGAAARSKRPRRSRGHTAAALPPTPTHPESSSLAVPPSVASAPVAASAAHPPPSDVPDVASFAAAAPAAALAAAAANAATRDNAPMTSDELASLSAKLLKSVVTVDTSRSCQVVILHASLPWLCNDPYTMCSLTATCSLFRRLMYYADAQVWRATFAHLFPGYLPVTRARICSWKAAVAARYVRTRASLPSPPVLPLSMGGGRPADYATQPLHIMCHNRAIHRIVHDAQSHTMATASWDGTVSVWIAAEVPDAARPGELTYQLTLKHRLQASTGKLSPEMPNGATPAIAFSQRSTHVTPFNVVIGMSSIGNVTQHPPHPPPRSRRRSPPSSTPSQTPVSPPTTTPSTATSEQDAAAPLAPTVVTAPTTTSALAAATPDTPLPLAASSTDIHAHPPSSSSPVDLTEVDTMLDEHWCDISSSDADALALCTTLLETPLSSLPMASTATDAAASTSYLSTSAALQLPPHDDFQHVDLLKWDFAATTSTAASLPSTTATTAARAPTGTATSRRVAANGAGTAAGAGAGFGDGVGVGAGVSHRDGSTSRRFTHATRGGGSTDAGGDGSAAKAASTAFRHAIAPAAATAAAAVTRAGRLWAVDINTHWLVAGGDSGHLLVWDARTCSVFKSLQGHTDTIYSVSLHSRGRAMSGCADGTVRVWDVIRGKCLAVLHEHTDAVMVLKSAGDMLVSGSADTTIRVWRISKAIRCHRRGRRHQRRTKLRSEVVTHGQRHGRHGSRGRPPSSELVLTGHHSTVYSLCLDAHVPLLVSGSHDGELRLWNVQTGRCVGLLKPFGVPRPHSNALAILDIAMVHDAQRRCVVIACRNGMVRSLDLRHHCAPALTLDLGVGNARSLAIVGGTRIVIGDSSGRLCIRRAQLAWLSTPAANDSATCTF